MEYITQQDLEIGMYLNNDGPAQVALYDDWEHLPEPPTLLIKKGELIGQIVDFKNGPDGLIVIFISDKITQKGSLMEKAVYYSVGWLLDDVKIGFGARFKNIQNCVRVKQVAEQKTAIQNAKDKGVNLTNMVKKAAGTLSTAVSETVKAIIPWDLVWIAGGIWLGGKVLTSKTSK